MPDYLPYLAPADPAGHFLPGYQAGAAAGAAHANRAASMQEAKMRIAASMAEARMRSGEASARLAETARQADMDYQVKQQQLAEAAKRSAMEVAIEREKMQSSMMVQEQRLAIEDQYRQIQLGLQAERLAETKRMNEEKIIRAARQSAAKMRYAAASQQPGFDPIKAALAESADLDMPASSIATLAGKIAPKIPPELQTQTKDGQQYYLRGQSWSHVPTGKQFQQEMMMMENRYDLQQINKIETDLLIPDIDKKVKESLQAKLKEYRTRVEDRKKLMEEDKQEETKGSAPKPQWRYDRETGQMIKL